MCVTTRYNTSPFSSKILLDCRWANVRVLTYLSTELDGLNLSLPPPSLPHHYTHLSSPWEMSQPCQVIAWSHDLEIKSHATVGVPLLCPRGRYPLLSSEVGFWSGTCGGPRETRPGLRFTRPQLKHISFNELWRKSLFNMYAGLHGAIGSLRRFHQRRFEFDFLVALTTCGTF